MQGKTYNIGNSLLGIDVSLNVEITSEKLDRVQKWYVSDDYIPHPKISPGLMFMRTRENMGDVFERRELCAGGHGG